MTEEYIPYSRQSIDEDDIEAVVGVLKSEWLTTGPAVDAFERDLARVAGAQAVAVSSGTAALHCAYHALGVGPDTEVITTPMTFVATAATAAQLGARVRFADVRPDTLNIDPEKVVELCSNETKVISAVDFAGHPADLDELRLIADERGIWLLEDASHALGAAYGERPVGSLADLTTFSFHPVKTITTGEGGAVTGSDATLINRVREFRNHGLIRDPSRHRIRRQGAWHQEVHEFGLNYRLPDILAALGRSQLSKLERFLRRRTQLANRYTSAFADVKAIRTPYVAPDVRHGWHLYTIRVRADQRSEIFRELRANQIGAQVHYLPSHLHPVFVRQGCKPGDLPIAEAAYEELISFPLYPDLSDPQQDRVIETVTEAIRR